MLFGIEVRASGRVFEDILRPPGSSRQTAIAATLEKLKFKFQNLQEIALIFLHFALHTSSRLCISPKRTAVVLVTWQGDSRHSQRAFDSSRNIRIGCHLLDGYVCQAGFVLYRVRR